MKFLRQLRAILRRGQLDAEMSEELRAHLELQAAENERRGMAPEEARYAAQRSFGGVEQVKERAREQRGWTWLEHAWRDGLHALRQLRKAPGFTAVVVASLAVGIGVNAAIFSQLRARVWQPMAVRSPHELVLFQWVAGPQGRPGSDGGDTGPDNFDAVTGRRTRRLFSLRMFEAFRAEHVVLHDVFAVAPAWGLNVSVDGQAEISGGDELVSGSYHTALGVSALLGRTLRPEDDRPGAPPVVVAAHRFWQRRLGGDLGVIGRVILINRKPVTIVGVMPPGFEGVLPGGSDLTLPLAFATAVREEGDGIAQPTHWWLRIMARLAPGATIELARSSLEGRFQALARESGSLEVEPPRLLALSGAYRQTESQRQAAARQLGLAMGISMLVLLAACTNVANLLLARGAARRREFAMRLALGATRARLVRQLLTESLLLAMLGAGAGLLVLAWGRDGLAWILASGEIPAPDWRVVGFGTALGALTGVGFGLVPAFQVTRLDLTAEFQGGTRGIIGHRSRLGSGLLVAQVAISLVLLVSATLFVRTVSNLRAVDVGFDRTHLLLFGLDASVAGYPAGRVQPLYARVAERIGALPGVRDATYAAWPMLSNMSGFSASFETRDQNGVDRQVNVRLQPIAANYFASYEVPLLAGRAFTAGDSVDAARVAIVNRTFARRVFGDDAAVGRRIRQGPHEREIVGLVPDVRHQDLRSPPAPIVYLPLDVTEGGRVFFAVRTVGDPATMVGAIRALLHEIDPNLPLTGLRLQDETVEQVLLREERFFAKMSLGLGGLALGLVCIGLYGLVSFAVERRTSEIGIRMALGAQPRRVILMILRESLITVGIGVVAGLSAAGVSMCFITRLLYGLSPSDVTAYAFAAAVLFAIAVAACLPPASRAAKIDPCVALRRD